MIPALMRLLQAIQDSALADWVRVSEWGYPIILTLHSLGLALVVGVLLVINLRIIGFIAPLPLRAMRPLMTLVWCGLALNLTTGCILFTADAIKFFESPTFRFKMLSIALGIGVAVYFNASVLGATDPQRGGARMPVPLKVMAAASVAVWIIAISLGRYVAYE
jgi:hypothetical protein